MRTLKLSEKQLVRFTEASRKAEMAAQQVKQAERYAQECASDANARIELILEAHGVEITPSSTIEFDHETGSFIVNFGVADLSPETGLSVSAEATPENSDPVVE